MPSIACVLVAVLVAVLPPAAPPAPPRDGTFVGTTPCAAALGARLGVPAGDSCELLEWALRVDGRSRSFELRVRYGATMANVQGIGGGGRTLTLRGAASLARRTAGTGERLVLGDVLSLAQVGDDLLHLLDGDDRLMPGNGGWSYTLNRESRAEFAVDPALADTLPEMSYRLSPLASGPTVFGVFEGRTPCQGIASTIGKPVPPACLKAKWRITLFQDADTRSPSTFKVEGSLFKEAARTGRWTVERQGAVVVYRLSAEGAAALELLRADDAVLFLMGRDGHPLVGHQHYSYTLDRRSAG